MSRFGRSALPKFLRSVVTLYALVCLMFSAFASRMIWQPSPASLVTPALHGAKFEEVALVAGDGVALHAWFLPAAKARGAVLFCHGNGGNVEDRIDAARELVELDLSVLLFDYRGYGRSAGSPSEEGTYLDAESAWEHVTHVRGFAPARVIAWGESLGGAVAVELARRRAVGALVTEAAFTSLPDVASDHFPWLPVRWITRVRYASIEKVGALAALPWLLLHSPDDDLVPFAHAQRLRDAALAARAALHDAPPVLLVRSCGGHNSGGFMIEPSAKRELASFLDRFLPRAP